MAWPPLPSAWVRRRIEIAFRDPRYQTRGIPEFQIMKFGHSTTSDEKNRYGEDIPGPEDRPALDAVLTLEVGQVIEVVLGRV